MDDTIQATRVALSEAKPSLTDSSEDGKAIAVIGGTCVNEDQLFQADLIIQNGLISEVGPNLSIPEDACVINAKGKLIIPGGIDLNTHFQLPVKGTSSIDDFYSGTRAALSGGTTMIVDCVWDKSGVSLLEAFGKWRNWADGKVACDYSLAVGVTWWNDEIPKEMAILVAEKGVNTFRVSQEYKNLYMLNDGELLQVFSKAKELGALVTTLSENGHIIEKKENELISLGITGPEGHSMCRAEEVEAEATNRVVVLANQVRCPICVVPLTSKSSGKIISDYRRRGYVVFGAPVTASLGTDGTHYWNKCWRHAAAYVTVPSLRPDPTTPSYLMDLLANGDLQFASSAHCTFNADQKALGKDDFRMIPHGVNGVEERMSLIWELGVNSGRMDVCRFVSVTSSTPAKILNIYPQKGRIAVGSDADVVIWDPELSKTVSAKSHVQACDFNIFEGQVLRGAPLYVIAKGIVVMDTDGLKTEQGAGKYVPTPPHASFIYGRLLAREQALAPQKVDREHPGGIIEHSITVSKVDPVGKSPSQVEEDVVVPSLASDQFHRRPPTKSGARNLQESSFSLTGEQFDDRKSHRSNYRVINPPGGRSQGLW